MFCKPDKFHEIGKTEGQSTISEMKINLYNALVTGRQDHFVLIIFRDISWLPVLIRQ